MKKFLLNTLYIIPLIFQTILSIISIYNAFELAKSGFDSDIKYYIYGVGVFLLTFCATLFFIKGNWKGIFFTLLYFSNF